MGLFSRLFLRKKEEPAIEVAKIESQTVVEAKIEPITVEKLILNNPEPESPSLKKKGGRSSAKKK